ncbi:MAG: Na/Pi cotransporter family protein [Clostridia bacterium]|nr:Na/Pi cotransporter family protein [Clostridia bacterium]
MTVFDGLTLLGGLSLFLFGMHLMGRALEHRTGGRLERVLQRITSRKSAGLFTGMAVTAAVQSSSATTVTVVGFVNSGLMSLRQAIHVIMGANIGTTVTAWLLSLAGIESDHFWVRFLKPTSFAPLLAFAGLLLTLIGKSEKRKGIGQIFLGFAILMFGMDQMSDAVAGLGEVPAFRELFLLFRNPLLGVLAGALLTAIIQSSSASVGILQALALGGRITYGAVIPIVMGQNIGTCVTALISSVGVSKNGKRAAFAHLIFNIAGTVVWLAVFWLIKLFAAPAFLDLAAVPAGIAAAHTAFNVLSTLLLLPFSALLEKAVCRIIQ